MKVAMLAPISWRVPPRHYGPWERVVSLLTEGLVEKGVDVTLFATADSITKAKLIGVCPRPYSEDLSLDVKVWECLHISEVFERADEFDLIHNHFDFLPLSYSKLVKTPVVTTIHGFSSEQILPVYKKYNKHVYYVAISEADKSPELDYIATIHHGIDLKEFSLNESHGDYLLFFGRIHHEKGTAEAIEVARKTGLRLIIAGIIQDEKYFREKVLPFVDGKQIEYVGSVGPEKRNVLLGNAKALLHVINFEEPFGLSLIEAMACGTPVIATKRGSIPEIIIHGETGFIVENLQEAAEAIGSIERLDRKKIRDHVEKNFSVEKMVNRYIEVYKEVIGYARSFSEV
ncbi:MAG: glycosyltransferase family 4 protein [Pyrinomonadaceae bacterium]